MDLALAEALEITEEGISIGFGSLLISIMQFMLLLLPIILIIAYFFYKKRLEHKQIMAAIEKGIPLSGLRPAKKTGQQWIKSLTIGIALLLISLPFLYMFLEPLIRRDYTSERSLLTFGVLFALGLAFFIRGLLLRKAQRQIQPSGQPETEESKT